MKIDICTLSACDKKVKMITQNLINKTFFRSIQTFCRLRAKDSAINFKTTTRPKPNEIATPQFLHAPPLKEIRNIF